VGDWLDGQGLQGVRWRFRLKPLIVQSTISFLNDHKG